MPVALLVAERPASEPVVGPEVAAELARLGVTRVSLLADSSGVGVVLEGWAFDPARVGDVVRFVFPDRSAAIRVLREVEHVAVAPMAAEGSA